MIRLAIRTFYDRWPLFVGSLLASILGVAIVHAGLTIILGVENVHAPAGTSKADADAFTQAASAASTLTGMTVMLAVFLTIFVVSSTFGFAVDQRRPDLAALRLTGVTGRQVRWLLLGEALLVGLLSMVGGAFVGTLLTGVQTKILASLDAFPKGLSVSPTIGVLIFDAVLALTVCLVGAWGSARRATRISPLDAQRRGAGQERVMTFWRWGVAVVALVLTVVQTWFAATLGGMLFALLLGLGIVITASVALSQLSPLLVPATAGVLSPVVRRRPIAALAMANLRDDVRRTAACAAPMIVLVGLVMGLQGILDTQTRAAAEEPSHLLRADVVATGAKVDLQRARGVRGVRVVAPETVVPLGLRLVSGGSTTGATGTVVAVDPASFRLTHKQTPVGGALAAFDRGSIVLGPGLDSTTLEPRYDSIELDVNGRRQRLTEAARMGETLGGTDGYYVDRALVPGHMLEGPTTLLVQLDPGVHQKDVEDGLRAAGATSVVPLAEAFHSDEAVKNRENRGVMTAIVGLGSLYALITVLSTLAISITQRRGEFATLRLTGISRRQVYQAAVTEALTANVIGLLLGAVAAVLSLVGLWVATARTYGSPVIAIPWGMLLGLAALSLVLTAITSAVSAQRAMRQPPVQALGARE